VVLYNARKRIEIFGSAASVPPLRKGVFMKKQCVIVFLGISMLIISCVPSAVSEVKIESRYSYTSDEDAILGILTDVIEIDISNFNSMFELIGILRVSMFEEDKDIGNWLKTKFGSELRMGEVIKIVYKYKNEKDGFDFIYKSYNKDVFKQNLVSCYDFVTALEKIED
jgi:hypothetical protein